MILNFGIFTLNDHLNFGNRLQNYAVQYIFRQYGTVFNLQRKFPDIRTRLKYNIWNMTNGRIERIFPDRNYTVYRSIKFCEQMSYCRKQAYGLPLLVESKAIKKSCADYYIYGSDQIWNPYYSDKTMICPSTPKDKNIAFCASFGIEKIPAKYGSMFSSGLKQFSHISVREQSAADIAEKYTGIRPDVLVDPTMYVPVTHWRKIEKQPENFTLKKYVLVCFLGRQNDNIMNKTAEFSRANSADIADITSEKYHSALSPAEFIYLIDNARYVVTDSFHCAVFSILFHKPFSVTERKDKNITMNTRIKTLLDKFGCQKHYINSGTSLCTDTDYLHINKLLDSERVKTDEFILNSIGVEKNNGK